VSYTLEAHIENNSFFEVGGELSEKNIFNSFKKW
jgi:hypothetical protein